MPSVSLYFKVHLPQEIKHYSGVDVGFDAAYFDIASDKVMIAYFADQSYLPANSILAALIKKHPGKFRFSFSISGITLQRLQRYRPDVIQSFRKLANTGCVEFLAETSHNSLSWLYSKKEFRTQVEAHTLLIKKLFGKTPAVFRNTELIYNNELAAFIGAMGYRGIICEGLERILRGRNLNQVYQPPGMDRPCLLLRHARLSDDLAFRFDNKNWDEYPLTAEKYAAWLHTHHQASNINLLLDYETFGIHKKKETGIFDFLQNLPEAVLKNRQWHFTTASEALSQYPAADCYDANETISWNDKEIECCVWCENSRQNNMLKKIYSLENMVYKNGGEAEISLWRQLQCADYFYFMSEDRGIAGDAYQYHNPFASAAEAYTNYLHIITDFEIKLIEKGLSKFREENHPENKISLY